MPAIETSHLTKSFGAVKAVDDLSFQVENGEIFGLLGPNGAGKTTTIRLILDIFKPDRGKVVVLGGAMTEAKKERIGYMPEERGLYQDIPLERCLIYLGTLKGLTANEVKERAGQYLERFDLGEHRNKKVKELSKGMQQKAQIIATILHQPELLIIDEPFSGLDPVNTRMVKSLLLDLNGQGVTIIMSTHQMHQVEEMCDRILLVDHGQALLYGDLAQIRKRYSGHAVLLQTEQKLPHLEGVEGIEPHNSAFLINLAEGTEPQAILQQLVAHEIKLDRFEIATPTLDEIFVEVVQGEPIPA